MIYFDDKVKEKFEKIRGGDYYVLSDYDQTLTTGISSWELPKYLGSATQEFKTECDKVSEKFVAWLKEYNRTNNKKLRDNIVNWWHEELALFVKHKINLGEIIEAILKEDIMTLRGGIGDFLEMLNEKGVPFIILSAGFTQVIEASLVREACKFENIHVFSNKFRVDDNNCLLGVEGEMVHWLNKSESNLEPEVLKKIKNKPNIFLFGDQKSDIDMLPEDKREGAIKIAFRSKRGYDSTESYLKYFDIACDSNTSFGELAKALKEKFNFSF